METYAKEVLVDIEDSKNDTEYIKDVDELLEELVKENEDDIEVLIK